MPPMVAPAGPAISPKVAPILAPLAAAAPLAAPVTVPIAQHGYLLCVCHLGDIYLKNA